MKTEEITAGHTYKMADEDTCHVIQRDNDVLWSFDGMARTRRMYVSEFAQTAIRDITHEVESQGRPCDAAEVIAELLAALQQIADAPWKLDSDGMFQSGKIARAAIAKATQATV